MGCQLFRHMCDEYPELLDEVRDDVTQALNIWLKWNTNSLIRCLRWVIWKI